MNIVDIYLKDYPDQWVYSYNTIESEPYELADYPFTDYTYKLVPAESKPAPDTYVKPVNEWDWYIDVGPFFDRFGPAQIEVLKSADLDVQAFIKSAMARKWIDLKNTLTAQGVHLICGRVPAAADRANYVLNTPVGPEENRALRTIYFKEDN